MTTNTTPDFAAMTLPQMVETFNEMVATAGDLGLTHHGGKELREVTRFADRKAGERRLSSLHLEVQRASAFLKKEEAAKKPQTLKGHVGERAEGRARAQAASEEIRQKNAQGAVTSRVTTDGAHIQEQDRSSPVLGRTTNARVEDGALRADVELTPAENLQRVVEASRTRQAGSGSKKPKYTMNSTLHKGPNPYEVGTEPHETYGRTREGMTVREFCAMYGVYPRGLNYLTPLLRDGALETRPGEGGK